MKLILSRKGFDSTSGGVPSPIFPDGSIVSLPIPDELSPVTYEMISCNGGTLGFMVTELTGGRILPHHGAHIDPDLLSDSLSRQPGWKPIFGQAGAAQGHLRNNGIGAGDLFLFFGLFRRVETRNGAHSFIIDCPPCHVIWGWLQVDKVLPVDSPDAQDCHWAKYHPHFNRDSDPNNFVYLARRHLQTGIRGETDLPGAGIFRRFNRDLCLTAPRSEKTSIWMLPGWFHPDEKRTPLTYHADMKRWRKLGTQTELKTVARGQEFVLDCDEYPEAAQWACDLIQDRDGEN